MSKWIELVEAVRPTIKEVDVEQLKQIVDADKQGLVLDIREANERAIDYIPNSIFAARGVLEKFVDGNVSNLDQPIYLYCHSGMRTVLAAERLEQMGYSKVYSVQGGITQWRANGYKTVRD